MKAEQKQTVTYDDVKLEAMDQDKLDEIEEKRVQDIKAGIIEEQKIGGELVLKIDKGVNLTNINGKEKFAFNIQVPRYGKDGELLPVPDAVQMKMIDVETGKFKTKVRLQIPNHNMVSYFHFFIFVEHVPRDNKNKNLQIERRPR